MFGGLRPKLKIVSYYLLISGQRVQILIISHRITQTEIKVGVGLWLIIDLWCVLDYWLYSGYRSGRRAQCMEDAHSHAGSMYIVPLFVSMVSSWFSVIIRD
jgi:hypothetical protein